LAYLLLGVVTAGIIPVLLPLMINALSHRLSTVALVMGSYNVGLLSSPLWGIAAERRKLYRSLFFAGFVVAIAATATLPLARGLAGWLPLALLLGVGSSGAATVASLFIVNFAPRDEWEPRIGFLQSFNGTGQVVGLLLAGIFAQGQFSVGLWVAALLLLPALAVGRVGLPVGKPASGPHRRLHLNVRALAVFPHVNFPSGVGRHFHHLNMHGLRRLPEAIHTPFGRFILSWFMYGSAIAGFSTYLPLMLDHSYGVPASLTAVVYALAAGIGIALFILTSQLVSRFGSRRVYQAALWTRVASFALLTLLLLFPVSHKELLALIGFALIALAWPVLSVSGTGIAANLAPFSEGAAMGLFNAASALATVTGTFVSGPLVHAYGYLAIPLMAITGLLIAIVLSMHLDTSAGPAGKAATKAKDGP
jgi:MFS family permease